MLLRAQSGRSPLSDKGQENKEKGAAAPAKSPVLLGAVAIKKTKGKWARSRRVGREIGRNQETQYRSSAVRWWLPRHAVSSWPYPLSARCGAALQRHPAAERRCIGCFRAQAAAALGDKRMEEFCHKELSRAPSPGRRPISAGPLEPLPSTTAAPSSSADPDGASRLNR